VLKSYHFITGVISWLTILHLLGIRIPGFSNVINTLTKNKASTLLFGIFASKMLGNWFDNGVPTANPIQRIWNSAIQIFEVLTFKAAK
jgi:hypothetical protein